MDQVQAQVMAQALHGAGIDCFGVPPSPIDGLHNKYRFVSHIERTEGKEILPRLPFTFGGPG